jgi:hypothetical protein
MRDAADKHRIKQLQIDVLCAVGLAEESLSHLYAARHSDLHVSLLRLTSSVRAYLPQLGRPGDSRSFLRGHFSRPLLDSNQ